MTGSCACAEVKNALRGKLPKTTSSVVFAFLAIMLCQHGSTMKCTGVWRAMAIWETFLRGPFVMTQGKLRKTIYFDIIAS